MRKRFNRNRVASSDNYELSKSIHRQVLLENHEKNKEYFHEISISIDINITVNNKKPYVKAFGKLIPVPEEMLEHPDGLKIYWL